MQTLAPAWSELQRALAGQVVLPDSPGYDPARKPAMPRFGDIRPLAVVQCKTPADVAETLAFARRAGLPCVPRSGGHCFAGHSSTRGIIIDVTPMRSVAVSGGTAMIGAGTRLGDVYDALDAFGLTIPAGCGPTVGIAGLTLGGGLGILGRACGLTCDSLVSAQVVLADGSFIECDEQQHADLFWALRGAGGGNFGVVTTLTFNTLPAPNATVFHLVWPHSAAALLIEAWQAWAPDAPDELAASLLLTASADPDSPPSAHLFGVMLAGEAETARQLDEVLGSVGLDPLASFRETLPYREAKRYLAEHGPGEALGAEAEAGHSYSKCEFFRQPLPTGAIEALVEGFSRGRTPGQVRVLDFSPWGGAYNRVPAAATAFVHRAERFLLKQEVIVDPAIPASDREAAQRWLRQAWAMVHPWGSGGVYPNFPDPELDDWAQAYYGANFEQLMRVKAQYDPADCFNFAQSIPVPVGSGDKRI